MTEIRLLHLNPDFGTTSLDDLDANTMTTAWPISDEDSDDENAEDEFGLGATTKASSTMETSFGDRQWSEGDSYAWRLMRLAFVQLMAQNASEMVKMLRFDNDRTSTIYNYDFVIRFLFLLSLFSHVSSFSSTFSSIFLITRPHPTQISPPTLPRSSGPWVFSTNGQSTTKPPCQIRPLLVTIGTLFLLKTSFLPCHPSRSIIPQHLNARCLRQKPCQMQLKDPWPSSNTCSNRKTRHSGISSSCKSHLT